MNTFFLFYDESDDQYRESIVCKEFKSMRELLAFVNTAPSHLFTGYDPKYKVIEGKEIKLVPETLITQWAVAK